ncbi:MAG TPA: DUF2089 domain-containing protein [Desulfobacteraceae bacterium]|nr:DUF2089 domain-containing protein [Desulfobacteraceae bacterium]
MKDHLNNCPKCNSPLKITRYDCDNCGTAVEGEFSGCPFCRLDDADRLFALIFIQTEGNMKDVERLMGISYPTVKARLARLNAALAGDKPDVKILKKVKIQTNTNALDPAAKAGIIDRLASGDIDAGVASRLLRGEQIEEGQVEGAEKEEKEDEDG